MPRFKSHRTPLSGESSTARLSAAGAREPKPKPKGNIRSRNAVGSTIAVLSKEQLTYTVYEMVLAVLESGSANANAAPSEGVLHAQPLTTAYVNQTPVGQGTLYITDKTLTWFEESKNIGFSLLYPSISLHAIRREPIASLYMTIEHKLTLPEAIAPPFEPSTQREDSGEESDDNADEEPITELMFAPLDQDALPRMYSAMCDCQAMHPDPNDSFTDEDDDIYEDASEQLEDEIYSEQPGEPIDPVDEEMETLHIDSHNGHSADNGNMDYDPDQFADD